MKPVKFDSVEFGWVPASRVKSWSFALIRDVDGMEVVVEFQNSNPDDPRVAIFDQFVGKLRGVAIEQDNQVAGLLGITTEQAAANADYSRPLSALSTAVIEFQCHYQDLSMTAALGGTQQQSQQLYANVNRFLNHVARARTPRDFAAAAERAATEGFTIAKVDPFDEVKRGLPVDEAVTLAQTGFDRLEAMGEAAGPDVALLVDCHGSFTLESMPVVAGRLQELGVTWLEPYR